MLLFIAVVQVSRGRRKEEEKLSKSGEKTRGEVGEIPADKAVPPDGFRFRIFFFKAGIFMSAIKSSSWTTVTS